MKYMCNNSFIACIYNNHWLDNFFDAIENIIRIEKAIVIRFYMHEVLFHSKSDSSIFQWTVLFNFSNFLKCCLLRKIMVLHLIIWCLFLIDKFWCFHFIWHWKCFLKKRPLLTFLLVFFCVALMTSYSTHSLTWLPVSCTRSP